MKKNIFLILFFIFIISCFNSNYSENEILTAKEDDIEIEIVSVDSSYLTKLLDEEVKDKFKEYFSETEILELEKNNIDIEKLVEYKEKSLKGDANAITSLSYVYYKIKNYEKLEEVLKLGLKYNIKESIYNLALLEFENKRYKEALNYLEKLPIKYKENDLLALKNEIYIKLAVMFLEKKDYDNALVNLIKAYEQGMINLDYDIAKIYQKKKDNINMEIYLKKAVLRNNLEAMIDLANYYSENNQSLETIEIYKKLYASGKIDYASKIYEEYSKLLYIEERIKWYKISRNLGLINKNIELENLNEFYQ